MDIQRLGLPRLILENNHKKQGIGDNHVYVHIKHDYLLDIRLGEEGIAAPDGEAHYGSTNDAHQRDNLCAEKHLFDSCKDCYLNTSVLMHEVYFLKAK